MKSRDHGARGPVTLLRGAAQPLVVAPQLCSRDDQAKQGGGVCGNHAIRNDDMASQQADNIHNQYKVRILETQRLPRQLGGGKTLLLTETSASVANHTFCRRLGERRICVSQRPPQPEGSRFLSPDRLVTPDCIGCSDPKPLHQTISSDFMWLAGAGIGQNLSPECPRTEDPLVFGPREHIDNFDAGYHEIAPKKKQVYIWQCVRHRLTQPILPKLT